MPPNGEPFNLKPTEPPAGPYYPSARIMPAIPYQTIYISGCSAGVDSNGNWIGVIDHGDGKFEIDIQKQTEAALDTLDEIIKGASVRKGNIYNVVDATVYIVDLKTQLKGMNEVWTKRWGSRAIAPTRVTVGVKDLPDPRIGIEIKATAIF